MKSDSKLHEMAALNVYIFLFEQKCVLFDTDKDISYQVAKIDLNANTPLELILL